MTNGHGLIHNETETQKSKEMRESSYQSKKGAMNRVAARRTRIETSDDKKARSA